MCEECIKESWLGYKGMQRVQRGCTEGYRLGYMDKRGLD